MIYRGAERELYDYICDDVFEKHMWHKESGKRREGKKSEERKEREKDRDTEGETPKPHFGELMRL